MHSIIEPLSDLWWRGIITAFLTLLIFIHCGEEDCCGVIIV